MVYKDSQGLEIKPGIRYLDDIRSLLHDKEWAGTAPNLELYYMYRGIKKENGLRYDITVIPSMMLGQEFIKTQGHDHAKLHQELYHVLAGQGIFLMQKVKENKVEDVYAVKADVGDIIIIPPGYGHFTINPGDEELRMANWVSEECVNDYSAVMENQGACYYALKDKWIKNENYQDVPELRFEKPLRSMPKDLSFLK